MPARVPTPTVRRCDCPGGDSTCFMAGSIESIDRLINQSDGRSPLSGGIWMAVRCAGGRPQRTRVTMSWAGRLGAAQGKRCAGFKPIESGTPPGIRGAACVFRQADDGLSMRRLAAKPAVLLGGLDRSSKIEAGIEGGCIRGGMWPPGSCWPMRPTQRQANTEARNEARGLLCCSAFLLFLCLSLWCSPSSINIIARI